MVSLESLSAKALMRFPVHITQQLYNGRIFSRFDTIHERDRHATTQLDTA